MSVVVSSPASSNVRPAYFRSLAEAIRDADELISTLGLPDEYRDPARRAAKDFPLIVPRSFVARMRTRDPHDPLLRQVLPLGKEQAPAAGFGLDAVGDLGARRAPGLIHKYEGRALLIAAGSCAVNCRYCFRRHYPYGEDPRQPDDWQPALDEIAADTTLSEVILSGGDPLMLTDVRLAALILKLEAVPHLRRLRIHTRLPIVLPDRVTPELLDLLASRRLAIAVVVHANHPQELSGDCAASLTALSRTRATILNQSVLLRDVNDRADVLAELSERLFDLGVMPYYLHQLDRVAGAAHFEVPEDQGTAIVDELRRRLPGYLVPRYVRETAGEASKLPIS